MTYVAVKGGERAIANAEALLYALRRGDPGTPEIAVEQIDGQLALAVDRVMCEGSLYDRLPIETSSMEVMRRISAIFKDVPGGQFIGPSFDYTQRLLDFTLLARNGHASAPLAPAQAEPIPVAIDLLRAQGLVQVEARGEQSPAPDLTREPLRFPAERALRLQSLARADEGFLLGMAYSTQRGYGNNHPFAGEVRVGDVEVMVFDEELGCEVVIGEIVVTEVQMVNQFVGNQREPAQFTCGYGLTLGYNERKAMSVALVDRALRSEEFGERVRGPAQDAEFVLMHGDNVEAQGFVQHLKLPHYVDFQAELQLIRGLRAKARESQA